MLIFKNRQCPCCSKPITFQDYCKYKEENSGEAQLPTYLKCSSCKNIILSFSEENKYSEGSYLFMIYLSIISIYIFHTPENSTYIVWSILILLWLIIDKSIPFIFTKFHCFTNEEVTKIDNEYFTNGYILFFTFILIIGMGIGLFYMLTTIKSI